MSNEQAIQLAQASGLRVETIDALQKMETIAKRVESAKALTNSSSVQTAILSAGMRDLRDALPESLITAVFMPLQGSRLGFKADAVYKWDVVRDVVIEASLRGYRMIGNEVNIIASQFYATLEGLERRVREFPGLTDLEMIPGVPSMKEGGGGALVAYSAHWFVNGAPMALDCIVSKRPDGEVQDCRIPVRVNNGAIVDAIMGKAKRKMYARILEKLTNASIPEAGDPDAIEVPGEAVPARSGMFKNQGKEKAPEAPRERMMGED